MAFTKECDAKDVTGLHPGAWCCGLWSSHTEQWEHSIKLKVGTRSGGHSLSGRALA
jgi:hypothetical protein